MTKRGVPLKDRALEKACGAMLRNQGYIVDDSPRGKLVIVGPGKFISTRVDLFGCIDLLALHANKPMWLIQCTTERGVNERRRKIETTIPPATYKHARFSIFESRAVVDLEDKRRVEHVVRIHDWLGGYGEDAWVFKGVSHLPPRPPPQGKGPGKRGGSEPKVLTSLAGRPAATGRDQS